jgi:ribosomal protein S18 acetylase RimI-like enzyme
MSAIHAVQVRQAVLDDLEDIAPLFDAYRQFYGADSNVPTARQFLLERFNHGESIVFVAYSGAQSVGFTQLYPSFSSVSMKRVFILNDLYVLPGHRQQGVARQLLNAATNLAQTLGAVRVSLTTAIDNQTAQATYEALGWARDQQYYAYHFKL